MKGCAAELYRGGAIGFQWFEYAVEPFKQRVDFGQFFEVCEHGCYELPDDLCIGAFVCRNDIDDGKLLRLPFNTPEKA